MGKAPPQWAADPFPGRSLAPAPTSGSCATRRPNTLYSIVVGWPGAQLDIASLNSISFNIGTLTNVQLLGATAGSCINLPLPSQDVTGLKIALPAQPYTAMAYVVKMMFSGPVPPWSQAISYQWSAPVPITKADATLNLPGTVVGAACFGATSSSITVTLTNGANIVFYGNGSVATCTGSGTATGAFTASTTGNANFDTVLNGFEYDDGPHTITLNNLVPGHLYSVQLFALDDRDDASSEYTRQCSFQTPSDATNCSATFAMGNNVYVLGTFAAAATNMVIQQNLPTSNDGNLNALVVRQLPQVPVVSSIQAFNGNIIITGTNAAAGADYYMLGTTNLALPVSSWTVLSTNQFGPEGNFSVTNLINSSWLRGFYRLRQP